MRRVNIIITAWNAEGYKREIVIADEVQTRMHDARVKETVDGLEINPAEFPEMVRFTVKVERVL